MQLLIHTESIATMDAAKGRDLNATHHLLNASDFRCCHKYINIYNKKLRLGLNELTIQYRQKLEEPFDQLQRFFQKSVICSLHEDNLQTRVCRRILGVQFGQYSALNHHHGIEKPAFAGIMIAAPHPYRANCSDGGQGPLSKCHTPLVESVGLNQFLR